MSNPLTTKFSNKDTLIIGLARNYMKFKARYLISNQLISDKHGLFDSP